MRSLVAGIFILIVRNFKGSNSKRPIQADSDNYFANCKQSLKNEGKHVANQDSNQRIIHEKAQQLLQEKSKLLDEYGLWFIPKDARDKHKEINKQLEALGIAQGKLTIH